MLSSGAISPFVAKAQTVNFGAASSTKLSKHCRGDGTDEAEKIEKVLNGSYLYVEVDEPPGGVAYGIGRKEGVRLRSGLELDGTGFGKFIRAGRWINGQLCLRNSDFTNGNAGIKLNNIRLEGRRQTDPTVPERDTDCDTTGIVFRVLADTPEEKLRNITLTGVEVHNWPGMGIRVVNGKHFNYTDVKNINSARDGIRFTAACYDLNLLRCVSQNTGETSFGFWATGFVYGQPNNNIPAGDLHDVTLTNCQSSTRLNAQYGAALMLYGVRAVRASNCTFGPAKNDVVHVSSDSWTNKMYVPTDILIENCKMLGGSLNSFEVAANRAVRVEARNNYMSKPARNCVHVRPMTKRGVRDLDVRIIDNTLVAPRRDHIVIDNGVRGVTLSGNRLVYSDATRPSITNVEPREGTVVTRVRPTIKAVVKDNRGGSGITKRSITLFFNGHKIDPSKFKYFQYSGNLTYQTPQLKNGRHTVRIVAEDAAKNTASRSWNFTVKV
jgi:hypothetical protein